MFWVSFAGTLHPVMIYPTARHLLTSFAQTDRVIRLPSPLGWAADHRHSQVESGFRADYRSRIDLQHNKRYRVHVRVSIARSETFLLLHSTSFH